MICFKRPKAALRMWPNLDAARRQRHRSFVVCYMLLGVQAMVSVRCRSDWRGCPTARSEAVNIGPPRRNPHGPAFLHELIRLSSALRRRVLEIASSVTMRDIIRAPIIVAAATMALFLASAD